MTTLARVESISTASPGHYVERVTLTYRRLVEGEADVIMGTAEMASRSFRGVFGAEPKVGDEHRVTTERVESGA